MTKLRYHDAVIEVTPELIRKAAKSADQSIDDISGCLGAEMVIEHALRVWWDAQNEAV